MGLLLTKFAAMGNIPAKTAMISVIITNPQEGEKVTAGQTFNVSVQTQNLVAGAFTNADTTYYAAPQDLKGGQVIGHTHITIQDLGKSLNPTTPPDATQFAFFKGINDAGNGKGLLQATVNGGLPAGNYRVCTITSASNHQPALMPVAQRGTCDDCTKFTVVGNGGTTNVAANDGSGGVAAAAKAAEAVKDGPGAITTGAAAAAAAATTAAAAKGGKGAAAANANAAAAAATTAATGKGGKGAAAAAANAASSTVAAAAAAATAATGKGGKAAAAAAAADTAAAAGGNTGGKAAAAAKQGGGQVRRQ